MLNEAALYLSDLLDNEKYIYNRVRYQETASTVHTCGSHDVHRIYRLKHEKNMDLEAYTEFMRSLKHDYGITYDMIVAEFVDRWVRFILMFGILYRTLV